MRIGLLVLGGGSWEIPQVFLLTTRQLLSLSGKKSLASSSLCAFFSTVESKTSALINKEEGPWKVQKLNQPKQ